MNWLSTMKMRSNFAASASCARAMYQRISTLAWPGISGLSQVLCCPGPPTPIRMARVCRTRDAQPFRSLLTKTTDEEHVRVAKEDAEVGGVRIARGKVFAPTEPRGLSW